MDVVRNSGIICIEQVFPCPEFSKGGEGQSVSDILFCFSICILDELQNMSFYKKNNKHCALNFAPNFKRGD